ncbi:DivIVA domain-containing protein [Mycolicibacterium sp. P9-64]|uniref:DivIVA domain-containing protein n=1 Tax=Mycolicibacterium sp. P9-64 TaxID=2024612 RepID=UPI002413B124|nr:DivIVA domain-containing protein [Mycolicibacterium sp. P9-64]
MDDFELGRRLTAADVHDVAFSKPPMFKRGYHEDEVDELLERVEAALRDPTGRDGITAAELHDVTFSKPPMGKRGYNSDEVDAFLEVVRIEFTRR